MSSTTQVARVKDELLAIPSSVGVARDKISRFVRQQGLGHLVDDALLVFGELANNAVEATPDTGYFAIYAARELNRLIVAAGDPAAMSTPRAGTPVSTLDEIDAAEGFDFGGWGLPIVSALADEWWVQEDKGGKWVCAALRVRGEGGSAMVEGGVSMI